MNLLVAAKSDNSLRVVSMQETRCKIDPWLATSLPSHRYCAETMRARVRRVFAAGNAMLKCVGRRKYLTPRCGTADV
jgi:hypothetical protein